MCHARVDLGVSGGVKLLPNHLAVISDPKHFLPQYFSMLQAGQVALQTVCQAANGKILMIRL